MEALIQDLVALLSREAERHRELLAVLEDEVRLDGQMEAATLVDLQRKKYGLAHAIAALEEERLRVVGKLARLWNVAPQDLTLRRIADRLADDGAQGLLALHSQLVTLVENIRQQAQAAGANAQARLKAVNATLDVMKDALNIHATYSEEGRLKKATPRLKNISA